MADFEKYFKENEACVPALFALQEKARALYLKNGLPNAKTEAFKYTNTQNWLKNFEISTGNGCDEEHCQCHTSVLPFECYEIHICNGKVHTHFDLPEGIEMIPLLDAVIDHEATKYINKFDLEKFPFAVLNTACLQEGLFVRVEKGFKAQKPLALIYQTKKNVFSNIHNLWVLKQDAEVCVMEVFEGAQNAAYFINLVNEIYLGQNGVFSHYKLQDESENACHIALNVVYAGANSRYVASGLAIGGKIARDETHVFLQECSAHATVNGAYKIKNEALVDTTTDIEHLSPCTFSDQKVKGVAEGRATGVFQGKIHIAPNADKTEGYQIHRALLLSDEACVNVKPELEIFADDVKCSHGATSGDIDPEQLFYLKSRGIDEQTARKLLIKAFLDDVLEKIENLQIKEFLQSKI